MTEHQPGKLFVVATPIGCLEDITLRAIRVLNECDLILAEDTRHSKKLCNRHDIKTPLSSLHAHSSDGKIADVISKLRAGATMALISDAGTPLVSDPGRELLAQTHVAGLAVEVVPGPSAVTAALCASGLPFHRFAFEGFLPRGGKRRSQALARIASSDCAIVFFESPARLRKTLVELQPLVTETREIAVCRELTKAHEEVLRGTLASVVETLPERVRGEITIVVSTAEPSKAADTVTEEQARDLIATWRDEGLRHKELVARLREHAGWQRDRAYQAVLEVLTDAETDSD